MEELRDMLKPLRAHEALGSAVIARDGTVIASDISKDTNLETFAIMMATMLGASVTAAYELKKTPPRTVIAESEDSKIVLYSTGGKALLVVVLPKDKDEKEVREKSQEILRDIEKSKL